VHLSANFFSSIRLISERYLSFRFSEAHSSNCMIAPLFYVLRRNTTLRRSLVKAPVVCTAENTYSTHSGE
jgi:hypothetical protein